MKKLAVSLVLSGLFVSTVALAGWTKAGVGQATFSAIGTGGFKMEGKTPTVDVTDDGKVVTVVVGLTELVTGISLRDRHMRDKYLEVSKFPTTTLTVAIDALKIASADNVFDIGPYFERRFECGSFRLPLKRLDAEIEDPQLRILRESELHGRFERERAVCRTGQCAIGDDQNDADKQWLQTLP